MGNGCFPNKKILRNSPCLPACKQKNIATTIGVVEITAAANLRASVTFNYFEAYMILMMIYWVIILVLERIEAIIEQKFDVIYKK